MTWRQRGRWKDWWSRKRSVGSIAQGRPTYYRLALKVCAFNDLFQLNRFIWLWRYYQWNVVLITMLCVVFSRFVFSSSSTPFEMMIKEKKPKHFTNISNEIYYRSRDANVSLELWSNLTWIYRFNLLVNTIHLQVL